MRWHRCKEHIFTFIYSTSKYEHQRTQTLNYIHQKNSSLMSGFLNRFRDAVIYSLNIKLNILYFSLF